jgi:hypothetical protein
MMLSILLSRGIAAKMMSPDHGDPPSPYIDSPHLPALLTISRTFGTFASPLQQHGITVDNIFNTLHTCKKKHAFDIHYSSIDCGWEFKLECDAFWLP